MTQETPGVTSHGTGAAAGTPARTRDAAGGALVAADRVARWLVPPPAVVTTLVVLAVAGWGLLLAAGAESMFDLSAHVSQTWVNAMAATSVALTWAGALTLVARHRRPLTVTAVVAVLAVASLVAAGATNGLELALAVALCAVATARRPRDTWLVAAAVVVPVVVTARLAPLVGLVGARVLGLDPAVGGRPVPGPVGSVELLPWLVTALPVVVLALLGVAAGMLVRSHRLRAAALVEATAARAAEEAQRERLTQADERARVAREMHDIVAHSITVMVTLGGGAAAVMDRSPDKARLALDELVETGRAALDDVRRILGVLHASQDAEADGPRADVVPMEPQPDGADLVRLVERFRTAGLPVRTAGLAVAGLDTLGTTVQLAVYRIVQESLTNTLRHAPGTARVDVDVQRLPGAVEVVVTDQGPGEAVAPSPGTRRGVVGMRERAAAFGGDLEAGPYGQGWRVRAVLPLPTEEEA